MTRDRALAILREHEADFKANLPVLRDSVSTALEKRIHKSS